MIILSTIFIIVFGYFFMYYLIRIGFAVLAALASLAALFVIIMALTSIFGIAVLPIVIVLCLGIMIGRAQKRVVLY